MVHAGMRHNNNQGAERNWARASKSHWDDNNVVKLVARLSSNPSKRENTILTKRHEIDNTLRRIVSSGMGCKSNYGGYLYLGWNQNDDDPQQINIAVDVSASLLSLVPISVTGSELGGGFIIQKRARYYASPLKKWAGNKAHPRSSSTITRRAEFQQHNQTTTIASDDQLIFLVNRSGKFEHLPNKMGTRTRKYGRLFHKTFRGNPPSWRPDVLCENGKFTAGNTESKQKNVRQKSVWRKSVCTIERVC